MINNKHRHPKLYTYLFSWIIISILGTVLIFQWFKKEHIDFLFIDDKLSGLLIGSILSIISGIILIRKRRNFITGFELSIFWFIISFFMP